LQHHGRIGKLRQYLLLVRLPNVFTTPSNILVGYLATTPPAEANGFHLAALMVSSGLLYIAGVVLNDYFDVEVDRRERPSRPLPSGSISKERAMSIALIALAAANAIALAVSPASLAVSAALTAAIIAYDYRLKRSPAGPFAMGSTRFLNVILGASPALSAAVASGGRAVPVPGIWAAAIFAATSLFVYIIAIMILSKKEVGNEKPNTSAAFSIIFAMIASIALADIFLLQLQWVFLINLMIFAAVIVATYKRLIITESSPDSNPVQQAIKNMVISIIILDSVFVSGMAGFPYGMATLVLIAPAILLAKKLYVT
jgi:4-hydroxybenzoate polyprenyltransferase